MLMKSHYFSPRQNRTIHNYISLCCRCWGLAISPLELQLRKETPGLLILSQSQLIQSCFWVDFDSMVRILMLGFMEKGGYFL